MEHWKNRAEVQKEVKEEARRSGTLDRWGCCIGIFIDFTLYINVYVNRCNDIYVIVNIYIYIRVYPCYYI